MYFFLLITSLALFISLNLPAQVDFSPTIYGNLHFEYRYWQQEASNYSPITAGGSTVENFPNRLGVYGLLPTSNFGETKLTYLAEISLPPRHQPGTVNLRLVAANLEHRWGKLAMGQCYTAAALTGLEFDPLHTTGAGQIGYDLTYDGQTAHGLSGIGYSSRWYQDTIKYTSPRFAGLQITLSVDRNSEPRMQLNRPSILEKELLTHKNSAPATYYEGLVHYQWQENQYTSSSYVGAIWGSGSTLSADFSDYAQPSFTYINQDHRFFLGHKVRWHQLATGFLYSELQQKGQFTTIRPHAHRYLFFISYFQDLWQYDATYGEVQLVADQKKTQENQSSSRLLAFSVMRSIAPTASIRLSAFHYQADLAEQKATHPHKNTIIGLISGLYLKF